MIRFIALFGFLFGNLISAQGQQWAGPDTSTCGQLGALIGSSDPCEDCCYFWTPGETLNDPYAKNPTATPDTETEYTVVVLDKNLRKVGTDNVIVRIGFGEMQFHPDFLIQSDQTKEVSATLLKHVGVNSPADIAWDFFDDDLGCMITPSGIGCKIKPGEEYGHVTIEARKVGFNGCFVRKKLDVNNGVKEVMAIDPDHQGRIAKTGETLYLIDHDPLSFDQPVIIHALPNAEGFKNGVPDWKPDTYGSITPNDGDDYLTISEAVAAADKTSEYIAGDGPDFMPKVKVVRKPIQGTTTSQFVSPGFTTLANAVKNAFKFKEVDNNPPLCGSNLPFTLSVTTPIIEGTMTEVEVYNHPKTSHKRTIAAELGFTIAGRVYHPAFTKSITSKLFNFQFCSQFYGELTAGLGAAITITKDPSKADSTWQAPANEVSLSLGIGGGLDLGVAPPGFKFLLIGKLNSSFKIALFLEGFDLKAKGTINPLTLKVQAKIQQQTDPGKFEDAFYGLGNLSHELQIFNKIETTPVTLFNFPD